ncbi:MAG: DUF4113 domain-containing protein, partial [Alcaligenaceae bacterium]
LSKAGVMLLDLQAGSVHQRELDLEDEAESDRDRSRLMEAMDSINGRYGKGTLHVGSTGATETDKDWSMKQERRTPRYTTSWEEMPIARA